MATVYLQLLIQIATISTVRLLSTVCNITELEYVSGRVPGPSTGPIYSGDQAERREERERHVDNAVDGAQGTSLLTRKNIR